jgi:hypothetical protein
MNNDKSEYVISNQNITNHNNDYIRKMIELCIMNNEYNNNDNDNNNTMECGMRNVRNDQFRMACQHGRIGANLLEMLQSP